MRDTRHSLSSHFIRPLAEAITLTVMLVPNLAWAEQRVMAPDGVSGANFGASMDTDGTLMVTGAPFDTELGVNAGAAYVYRLVNEQWTFDQKLTASDGGQADEFGTSVAVRRDLIAVGARFAPNASAVETGAVYLYQYDGENWQEIEKFAGEASNEWYGYSVDIEIAVPDDSTSGDEISNVVIGVPRRTGPSRIFDGAVILVQLSPDKTQWEEIGEFFDDDTLSGGQTGTSVAMVGDVIAAGAPEDEQLGVNAGAVYLFARSGSTSVWNQQDRKQPGDYGVNEGGRSFGFSVAIDAPAGGVHVLVVGAPLNHLGSGGAVYFFDFDGGPVEQSLTPLNNLVSDDFGASVSIDMARGIAAVGARRHDRVAIDAGSVYLYQRVESGWAQLDQVEASDTAFDDRFGASVSLLNGRLLVGAPGDDADTPPDFAVGSAYSLRTNVFEDGFETGDTMAWSSTTP